jgi:hypothetical protein
MVNSMDMFVVFFTQKIDVVSYSCCASSVEGFDTENSTIHTNGFMYAQFVNTVWFTKNDKLIVVFIGNV